MKRFSIKDLSSKYADMGYKVTQMTANDLRNWKEQGCLDDEETGLLYIRKSNAIDYLFIGNGQPNSTDDITATGIDLAIYIDGDNLMVKAKNDVSIDYIEQEIDDIISVHNGEDGIEEDEFLQEEFGEPIEEISQEEKREVQEAFRKLDTETKAMFYQENHELLTDYENADGIARKRIGVLVHKAMKEYVPQTVEEKPTAEEVVKKHIELVYNWTVGALENDVMDGRCSAKEFKEWLHNEALEEIYAYALEPYYCDYNDGVLEKIHSFPAEYIKSCIQELLNRDMSTLSANEIITDTEQEDDIIRFEVGKKYFHRNSNAVWECTDTPKIAINHAKGIFKTIGLGFKTTDNEYIAISLDNLHIVDGVEIISSTYNGELRADDIAAITDKELIENAINNLSKDDVEHSKTSIIAELQMLVDICSSKDIKDECKQLIACCNFFDKCGYGVAKCVSQELKELISV